METIELEIFKQKILMPQFLSSEDMEKLEDICTSIEVMANLNDYIVEYNQGPFTYENRSFNNDYFIIFSKRDDARVRQMHKIRIKTRDKYLQYIHRAEVDQLGYTHFKSNKNNSLFEPLEIILQKILD